MAYSLETSSVKTIVPGATVSGFCDVVARQKIDEASELSAGEGISISAVDGKTVITNNISAGSNISLVYDMETNTYRIDAQGGDLTNYYQKTETSSKSELNTKFNDIYNKTDTSSKQEISAALQYVSANAGHTYSGIAPIQVDNVNNQISITGESLSAGPGIDMFSSGGYVVISANGGGGEGAIYTGISPIDVNNTTHQISAKGVSFGVQSPLFFVQDDNEAVIIGCSAGGGGTTELISTGFRQLVPAENSISTSSQLIDGIVRDTSILRRPMGGMAYGGTTTSVTNYNAYGLDFSSHFHGNDSAEIDTSFSIGWINCHDVIDSVETSASAWNDTTEVVQTNSASWGQGGGTTYTGDAQGALDEVYSNSGVWLTAHQDWTNTITAASSYAYSQATAQLPAPFDPTYLSGQIDNKLNKSESANYYPMTGNPSGFINELPSEEEVEFEELDLSDYALVSALDNKQNLLTDITDVQVVQSLPVSPVSSVLYLIPEV